MDGTGRHHDGHHCRPSEELRHGRQGPEGHQHLADAEQRAGGGLPRSARPAGAVAQECGAAVARDEERQRQRDGTPDDGTPGA